MTHETIASFAAPQDGRLTNEMKVAFERDGVIALEGFTDVAACRRLQARMHELIDDFDETTVRSIFSVTKQSQLNDDYFNASGDKIRFFFEDDAFDDDGQLRQPKHDSLNKVGHAMHDLDPVFDEFSRTPELAAVVASLGNRDPGLLQSMYIFKPPRIGGEVTYHQDSTFLYTDPESCLGLWFALEDATVDNGCMEFIRGGHKGPLRALNQRRDDGSFSIETIDDAPWPETGHALAEARAGTLVIFDGRTPHRSGPNRSEKSRHAYTLHVIDRQSHYPPGNWLQRSPDMPIRGFTE